jgi:hypothetical protein
MAHRRRTRGSQAISQCRGNRRHNEALPISQAGGKIQGSEIRVCSDPTRRDKGIVDARAAWQRVNAWPGDGAFHRDDD